MEEIKAPVNHGQNSPHLIPAGLQPFDTGVPRTPVSKAVPRGLGPSTISTFARQPLLIPVFREHRYQIVHMAKYQIGVSPTPPFDTGRFPTV